MIADVGHNWDQLDEDADRSEDTSRRLALCNMNWDQIKLVIFLAFLNLDNACIWVKQIS